MTIRQAITELKEYRCGGGCTPQDIVSYIVQVRRDRAILPKELSRAAAVVQSASFAELYEAIGAIITNPQKQAEERVVMNLKEAIKLIGRVGKAIGRVQDSIGLKQFIRSVHSSKRAVCEAPELVEAIWVMQLASRKEMLAALKELIEEGFQSEEGHND